MGQMVAAVPGIEHQGLVEGKGGLGAGVEEGSFPLRVGEVAQQAHPTDVQGLQQRQRHGRRRGGRTAGGGRAGCRRLGWLRQWLVGVARIRILAFLARREVAWTFGIVEQGARSRSSDSEGRLLAIFDVFDDWFQRDDFEACSFVNVLLEMGAEHPLGRASSAHLATIRDMVGRLAGEAGLDDPAEFARCWYILMKGCIVQAAEGDRGAARRARGLGVLLIAANRADSAA